MDTQTQANTYTWKGMRTLYCDNNSFQYSVLTSLKVEHCKTLWKMHPVPSLFCCCSKGYAERNTQDNTSALLP